MSLRTLAVFAVLSAGSALALDPSLRVSQYHKQYWQVEQGLPHSYVTAIAQNADGYLLVGTDEGLARFDGLNFRPLPSDPSLRLSKRWVSAALLARDSSLWLGTFDGMLVELRNGQVRSKHQMDGSVFDVHQDSTDSLWVSTRNGVFRLENGKLQVVPGLGPPLDTSWNVLAAGDNGVMWVVTAAGLFRASAGAISQRLPNSRELGDILTILAGNKGGILLGTTRGLFRLAEQSGPPVPVAGVVGPVVSLIEDRDGIIWAGTWGQGLIRVTGNAVVRWTSRDGLPEDFIRTLAEDAEGNLWIGMRSGGLGRWKDSRLVPLGPPEGLAGSFATTVAADPAGDLWLGTWRGGLYRLRNGALESQPTPLPTLYFTVRALAFDRLGHQWIGNWEGLFQFDGKKYQHFGSELNTAYRRVSALLFDRSGALWVGTADHGVFRFPEGRPTVPIPPSLLPDTGVTALLEDSAGSVWVGTAKGLVKFQNAWSPSWSEIKGLLPDGVESIFEDSRKRIWVSTSEGGAAVISPGVTVVLDRKNGMPSHPLCRILEATDGSFWVSSPKGILELPAASLEQVLSGKRKLLDVVVHGQDDGMRTIECHGLSQPAGGREKDGSLWFPTAKGFVQVRAAAARRLPPPRAVIEEVTTDSGALPLAPELILKAGARNVEVIFTSLRFSNPRALKFRYRLSDYDPDWLDAGGERSARYNQLPPGPHGLEVHARDPFGEWSQSAALEFRQIPRFHQTWWFLMSLALLMSSIVFGIYRWRLHTLHGRYALVLEERNRIGREWHDTLVAGFSAISLQLEAVMARMKEQPERASEILDVTRKMVHHYRAEARRVIWDLRDSRPEGESLVAALEGELARMKENRGIEGQLTVTGEGVELPVEMQHNLLRICQEAISNAVRHGRPSRVDVDLVFTELRLRAAIRDDGAGFPAGPSAESAGHFGLTVMQERARRIGGQLEIRSRPGGGTVIQADFPLPRRKNT
ncbi:MAG: histidine kinase [Candidatus Solibacter sp.]|nr:histidine kinase [Candidatus Solibacter sp.]